MKFSVITPSLNQGKYLRQTIESVISQEGDFDIEYFVMDGGSIDDSVKILKEYEKKLKNKPKISFYWQSRKDSGQADAINQGIRKSTGDIISYINSDDYYLPGAFAKVADYFSQNQYKLWVVGNCQISDSKLSWTFVLKHLWPVQYFKNALFVFNTINQPSTFFKRALIKKAGVFNEKYHYAFDYDFWLRSVTIALPGRLFKSLSVFRIHQDSKSNNGYTKQFDEDWQIFISHHPSSIYFFAHAAARDFVTSVYKYLK